LQKNKEPTQTPTDQKNQTNSNTPAKEWWGTATAVTATERSETTGTATTTKVAHKDTWKKTEAPKLESLAAW